MKKLFSKKSGFSLVEILVAFVIFAMFAVMIMSILQLAIQSRKSNNEFATELSVQQEALVREDRDTTYDSSQQAGTLSLSFQDDSGSAAASVSIDYEMRSASPTATDSAEGLNYFIGDVAYDTSGGSSSGSAQAGGVSQAARYDTRITGTKGFDYIEVRHVVKDDTYDVSGQTRYLFETVALANDMDSITEPYAQYKLYFKMTDSVSLVEQDGNTYISGSPTSATIVSAGYVNSTTLDATKCSTTRENTHNVYKLTVLRNGGLQIGYDYTGWGTTKDFSNGGYSRFYVVFEGDPNLSVDSFGINGISTDSAVRYEAFTDYDGNYQPNIYGAYEFLPSEDDNT